MKKALIFVLIGFISAAAQATAILVDDFSGDLSAWTGTVILDNQNPGTQNVSTWQIVSGALQLNTTWRDGTSVEQHAMIRSGLALGVGHEIQIDVVHTGASQDIGLYVGGTTPTFNVRRDYVAIYLRNNGQVFSRGFDGTTEYALAGGSTPTLDKLFIARTDTNTYELGYYNAGSRTVVVTRTPNYPNAGTVVGIYADVRGVGVLGNVDNLTLLVPEPATMALLGLGALMAARKRS